MKRIKKKSIFVCRDCDSRNYKFYLKTNRDKLMNLKKYCSSCQQSVLHVESK